jgi:hypothetical protein
MGGEIAVDSLSCLMCFAGAQTRIKRGGERNDRSREGEKWKNLN